MTGEPYILAVSSHKGGTGRTTAALALAYCWGQAGRRVLLADADPTGAAKLVAAGPTGRCAWPNVRLAGGPPAPGDPPPEVVVVDGPALLGAAADALLARAHGLVLTGLADPVTLRSVPAATAALAAGQAANPKLELLGLLIGLYDPDPVQQAVLGQLRRLRPGLVLDPPVPRQAAVRDWAADPGGPLPAGPAADAFRAVAETLGGLIWPPRR